MSKKEWFASWFDSPYYHMLYKHRDDNEAQRFLSNLLEKIQLPSKANILDLACGKGRHATILAQMGYHVMGADLSENSILSAMQSRDAHQLKNLDFLVHDMRNPIKGVNFDAVFNLFTSFGYFQTIEENQRVCQAIHQMLKSKGILVIDFLNAHKVQANLKALEQINSEGLVFNIERWYDSNHFYKKIEVIDSKNIEMSTHIERVQALEFSDFKLLLEPHFKIEATFGSYLMEDFDHQNSDRLIIIAKKTT